MSASRPSSLLVLCRLAVACASLWLLSSPLLAVWAQSEADCTLVQGQTYSGLLCPSQQPPLTQTSPTSVLQGQPGASTVIPLPFTFPVYGEQYNSLSVNVNGYLSFGLDSPPISPQLSGVALPLDDSLVGSFPLIAALLAPLELGSQGSITWSVEGVGTDLRTLVVRWSSVQLACDNCSGLLLSMDVLLYEGQNGRVDVRYYQLNSTDGQLQASVGTQSDDFFSWFPYFSAAPIDDDLQAALLGSTLFLTYTGLSPTQCGGLGYDLSSLSTADLRYSVASSNGASSNATVYYRPCGVVTAPACSLNNGTRQSSLCSVAQLTAGGSAAEDLMVFNPNSAAWSYLPSGLMMTLQDGSYCGVEGYPRVTVVFYQCDMSAQQAVITDITEYPVCVYNVNVSTSLVCGQGLRNNPAASYAPDSTLPGCQYSSGLGYNASWCPRAANASYGRTMQPLSNEVIMYSLRSDDGIAVIPIGFTFWFYDLPFTQLAINNNAWLSFGFTLNNYWYEGPFPGMGLPSTDNFPIIAPLLTDLNNGFDVAAPLWNNAGVISYSVEGAAPNRQLIIRFLTVNLCLSRDSVSPHTVTFDVVLTEGRPGGIEVRFYRIQINQGLAVQVGVHGLGSAAYTAVVDNAPLTVALASQLTSSSAVFSYTGPSSAAACGGRLVNLSSISADLTFRDSSSGLLFTLHPCGPTSASACSLNSSTAIASICVESDDGSPATPLAVYTPTSVSYSLSAPGTLTESMQDGVDCGGSTATSTQVSYVCSAEAEQPVLISAQQTADCQYAFTVLTAVVCQANFTGVGMPAASSTGGAVSLPDDGSSSSSSSGLSGGAVAGVVIGCLVAGAVLALVACWCRARETGGVDKGSRLQGHPSERSSSSISEMAGRGGSPSFAAPRTGVEMSAVP